MQDFQNQKKSMKKKEISKDNMYKIFINYLVAYKID